MPVPKHPGMGRPMYHDEKLYHAAVMNPVHPPPMPDCHWIPGREAWLMNHHQYGALQQRLGSPLDTKPHIHNSALPGYSSELSP